MYRLIFCCCILGFAGCTTVKSKGKSYSLSYQTENPDNFRSDFISYKDCLFQFRLFYRFSADIGANIKSGDVGGGTDTSVVSRSNSLQKNTSDTISVILRIKNDTAYYEFNKFKEDAVLIKKGTIGDNFPGMQYIADSGIAKSYMPDLGKAKDTIWFDTPVKMVNIPTDTLGVKGVTSFFYINDINLLTVFNINNQVKNISGKYCFAGYLFTHNGGKRKEGAFISSLKDLSPGQLKICEVLYQKILKNNPTGL